MVECNSCGKTISTRSGEGIRERDQSFHVECAPNDLLTDSISEWNAIYDRGVSYFVKKYSAQKGARGGQQANVGRFADIGKALVAESKRRKK